MHVRLLSQLVAITFAGVGACSCNGDADVEADVDGDADVDVVDFVLCDDVEVFADDPNTTIRECSSFSSRCDVPDGWAYYLFLDGCMNPICGDFTMTPMEWYWECESEADNRYLIHTLLQVDGPMVCYYSGGFDDCTWLDLLWDEGVNHDSNLSFEVRGGPDCCDVGDIFNTTEVWEPDSDAPTLQELVDLYGPPDKACGYVCNMDLLEHVYCAPLGADPDGCPPACGEGNTIPQDFVTDTKPLLCNVPTVSSAVELQAAFAGQPTEALQAGENTYDLTWATIISEEAANLLLPAADSVTITSIVGTVIPTEGTSDTHSADIGLEAIPCHLTLEADTAVDVILPVSQGTWDLNSGGMQSLTLSRVTIEINAPFSLTFSTEGEDPACEWSEGPPELRFSVPE